MINQKVVPTFVMILGLLIIFLPTYIFPACGYLSNVASKQAEIHNHHEHVHEDSLSHNQEHKTSYSKCYWTAQAEIGIGTVILLLGLFAFLIKPAQIRLELSLALICVSGLAAAIPTILIGVCSSDTMICKVAALPALLFVSGILFILGVSNVIFLSKQKN